MNAVLADVNKWLRQKKYVRVKEDWLRACLEWLKEQSDQQSSLDYFKEKVYEQWLYSDLAECGEGCLPSNIDPNSLQPLPLNGIMCLQVNSVINVAVSAYSQLQKVKGQELDECTDEFRTAPSKSACPNRLLYLELTDGIRTIHAMEYRPLGPAIEERTAPGCKVMLKGNLQYRLGIVLLQGSNLDVLGGSVDRLVEENSMDKILARALKNETLACTTTRPPSGHPQTEGVTTDQLPVAPEDDHRRHALNQTATPTSSRNLPGPSGGLQGTAAGGSDSILSRCQGQQSHDKGEVDEFDNFDFDDLENIDDFDNVDEIGDLDDFNDFGEDLNEPLCEDDFVLPQDYGPEDINPNQEVPQQVDLPPSVEMINLQSPQQRKPIHIVKPVQRRSSPILLDDSPESSKPPPFPPGVTPASPPRVAPLTPPGVAPATPPRVTIKELQDGGCSMPNVKFKGRSKDVIEKLTCEGDQWSLLILVEDETGSLAVQLSNEILEALIGFSAEYFRKEIEPKRMIDEQMKIKGRNGFRRCQYTISELDCWMEVETVSRMLPPVVRRLY